MVSEPAESPRQKTHSHTAITHANTFSEVIRMSNRWWSQHHDATPSQHLQTTPSLLWSKQTNKHKKFSCIYIRQLADHTPLRSCRTSYRSFRKMGSESSLISSVSCGSLNYWARRGKSSEQINACDEDKVSQIDTTFRGGGGRGGRCRSRSRPHIQYICLEEHGA